MVPEARIFLDKKKVLQLKVFVLKGVLEKNVQRKKQNVSVHLGIIFCSGCTHEDNGMELYMLGTQNQKQLEANYPDDV